MASPVVCELSHAPPSPQKTVTNHSISLKIGRDTGGWWCWQVLFDEQIWDTAVDDRTSFRNLALWRSEFLYYADVHEGSTFPFIVVGNKVDVPECEKQVSTEEAQAWCAENGDPPLVETSAKDATNVEAAFGAAVAAWTQLEARLERPIVEDTVDLSKQQSPHRSSCCMPISTAE
ncbi:hypothetical protein KM043_004688 [Ampulex compressa]|nr:hypothetical protein KM043_004688 [Ampulex compressa]